MIPRELARLLARHAEQVCRHLLPNGKKVGSEWCVGDLGGGPGDSCRIHLTGEKAGVWSDFASGESGGDLLDLWVAVRRVSLSTAMREAGSLLGVSDGGSDFEYQPRRRYTRPTRPSDARRPTAVADYLNSRGLTDATIAKFQIGEKADKDGRPVIIFPYKRDGDLIGLKYLAVDRDAQGHKKTWGEKDCEPCLFGWQALDPNTRAVALTEGEIDAMTLHQVGIPALSVPNGAGAHQWIESEYDHLERFDQIFIVFDSDRVGHKGAIELLDRLGRHRCRVVSMPHKDPNEALLAGATAEEFYGWIAGSKTVDPDELKNAAVFTDEVIDEFYPSSDDDLGVPAPWPAVADHVRFRPAEVSIWTGVNGSGKSLLLGFLAVHVMGLGHRVCIASMEMLPRKTLARMTRQSTGLAVPSREYIRAVQDWMSRYLWMFDVRGVTKVDRLFYNMDYASRRYAIKHFVVDSLLKCGIAEDDYNAQKAFVEQLTDFAHHHKAHIHLVVHPRKRDDEETSIGKMDVKGTGAITDLADNVFSVWRNRRKERTLHDVETGRSQASQETVDALADKPDVVLGCVKQRNGEWEKGISLWFCPESLQYLGSAGERRKRFVHFAASPENADSAVP